MAVSESLTEYAAESPGLDDEPENWQGHIIICGLDNLGFRIVEQLHQSGLQVVIIDDEYDPRLGRKLKRWGIRFIEEDSRMAETLLEAGIKGAAALIACEADDLHNLEIVLLANEMREGLRCVARMYNQQIGTQMVQAVRNSQVLSMSDKAGPSFVEGCLASSVLHLFDIADDQLQVVEVPVEQEGTIGQLYSQLTPLAVLKPEHNQGRAHRQRIELAPTDDYRVQPGESVILVGRSEDFAANGVRLSQEDVRTTLAGLAAGNNSHVKKRRPRGSFFRLARRMIATLASEVEPPFRYALVVVGIIIVFSTILLTITYRNENVIDPTTGQLKTFDVLDALYFTITIIATVGFGDYSFALESPWLKIYGIFLILVGATSISILYAFVTNFIISRRIEQALGKQKATNMEDHVIICGLGSVGVRVMEGLLNSGREVVIIERDENNRYITEARAKNVPIIFGDSKLPQVLRQANLAKASAIAVMTSDDLANLETALNARATYAEDDKTNPDKLRVVLRIFDPNLAAKIEANFGIPIVRSASTLAAPYFVGAALGYDVISTFYVQRQPFIVSRLVVRHGSELDGRTIQQLEDTAGLRTVAWRRGPLVRNVPVKARDDDESLSFIAEQLVVRQLQPNYHPQPSHTLRPGDQVYFVGPYQKIIAAYRQNQV